MTYLWLILGLFGAFVVAWYAGDYSPGAVAPALLAILLAAINGFSFGLNKAKGDWSGLVDQMIALSNGQSELLREQTEIIKKLKRRIEVGYEEDGDG